MNDRIRTLTVVLDRDLRIDEVESVVKAILMIRCVEEVEAGPVVDMNEYAARSIAFGKLKRRLWRQVCSWEADKTFDLTKMEEDD